MSIDYWVNLIVGYRFSKDKINDEFLCEFEQKSHEEDRYDIHDGHFVERITVVDEEGGYDLKLDGKRYEYYEEFAEALGDKLGCEVVVVGEEDDDNVEFIIGYVPDTHDDKFGQIWALTTPGSTDIKALTEAERKLVDLEHELTILGLPPGDYRVYITPHVSG